jgi:pimeloyl-ACP methyl ester carboxylesterase
LVPPDTRTPVLTRAAAPETPFFFESGDRPCYAVLHAAAAARPDAPVVVHVHSLGVEQLSLYRQEVLTARAAAAAGFAVMRHHARGHGDSAGDFAAVTCESLVADARAAAAAARRRTGATRVVWLGVRFGAAIAALAAQGRDDTAGFILWEPVHRATTHFRDQLRFLLFSNIAGGIRPDATPEQLIARAREGGVVDVSGYQLHAPILASVETLTLAEALAPHAVPVAVAQIQQRAKLAPATAQLLEGLAARGRRTFSGLVHEEPGYQHISNPAWECPALTALTREWLDAMA